MGDNSGSKRARDSNTPSPENPVAQPTKKVNMGERTLEDLFQAINCLDTSINGRIKSLEDGLKASVKTLAENLETKFQVWEVEKTALIGKQRELEQRIHDLERRERKNGAIITGLGATRDNVKVVKVFVRFHSFDDKMSVFKQKKNLTGPDGKEQVFINDDLTRADREMQYHARSLAKTLRGQKKTVKMGHGKLCVDGEWMVWDESSKTFVSQKN